MTPDLLFIGGLYQHESDALDHVATEIDKLMFNSQLGMLSAGSWIKKSRQLPELFAILCVIQTFDEEDAVSIREAKVATSSSTVVSDLAYVESYFGNRPGVIVSMEARDLPLIESVKIMDTIQEGLKQTPGPVASSVATKLEQFSTLNSEPDVTGSNYELCF
uniref:Uncharacterized protein n=1 Tax=Timema poppense TaxID=170557 RepID=A0A7R9H6T0_TIMPO|nr:unnamed protein product [Timema poppensis]